MLNFYSFFHLNLMYSSIEEASRKDVVQKCYWPLFKLVDLGIPIGIEAPAVTLDIINELDPDWISSLSKYIAENKIEFIGSGYSQIIGPLVPAQVNEWNQQLGLRAYHKLLNVKPKIALINEMAYSGGIIEHYINACYIAIIMEWNNSRSAHPEWENDWRYSPQKAVGSNEKTIPLMWADSIAFQKFQRYTHGEYELKEYAEYLRSHIGYQGRFFPLYANDVEIFDYRPNRYNTEVQLDKHAEWDRIINLYKYLDNEDWVEFIFPSKVLDGLSYPNGGNEIRLESPEQPIPVKKQEKYNINRWALTGRDDLGINTICYDIYKFLKLNNCHEAEVWKNLCYLWSSDFRTHITDRRWTAFKQNLIKTQIECVRPSVLSDQTDTMAPSHLQYTENKNELLVTGDDFSLILNKCKGLTIKKLCVRSNIDEYLLGTLDHGYYDDISLGADYFSGHTIIEQLGAHKITDLGLVSPQIRSGNCTLELTHTQEHHGITFHNSYLIKADSIQLQKTITGQLQEMLIIHPFNFTFNPKAWDRDSLYIETNNGGDSENFYLQGHTIAHGDIYSSLISARHGFGNTEGATSIGDSHKQLKFNCDMTKSALIPSVIYKEIGETCFLRLQYAAREIDETVRSNDSKQILTASLTISW